MNSGRVEGGEKHFTKQDFVIALAGLSKEAVDND
jgi:hypothetical protein